MPMIHNYAAAILINQNPTLASLIFTRLLQIYLGNNQIPLTDGVHYLGLTIDRRMTWGPALKMKQKALNRRLEPLYKLLFKSSKLQPRQKRI